MHTLAFILTAITAFAQQRPRAAEDRVEIALEGALVVAAASERHVRIIAAVAGH